MCERDKWRSEDNLQGLVLPSTVGLRNSTQVVGLGSLFAVSLTLPALRKYSEFENHFLDDGRELRSANHTAPSPGELAVQMPHLYTSMFSSHLSSLPHI